MGRQAPLFANPITQREMLARDHTFDAQHLEVKAELKRLLHLEAFGTEPVWDPILLTAVGRLVEQKNLGLVADIIDRTLAYDAGANLSSWPLRLGTIRGVGPLRQPSPSMRPVTLVGSISTGRLIKRCRDSSWRGAIFV